jgi:hypothetical protein
MRGFLATNQCLLLSSLRGSSRLVDNGKWRVLTSLSSSSYASCGRFLYSCIASNVLFLLYELFLPLNETHINSIK